ncbi:MAG TPA: aspartate aminotransferase family protein [Polyangia bacterium]|nr:aspartate aminotransferase family protein [Polyangia bacterium]
MNSQEIREKHGQFTFATANYYKEPIALVRGEGTRLWDADGREYLDFFGGILTVSLGHCQKDVTAAVREQVGVLVHASTLYPMEPLVRLAERLAQITPGGGRLRRSFFTNSGTEADETAITLAKVHTGESEIIALRHAYSGRSLLAQTVTAHARYRPHGSQVPGVVHAVSPYCYRCPFGLTYPSCELKCAQDIEELILTTTCGRPAAFIAEPIQGVGGFITPPKEYFQVAVGIVRKHGGLFICDEVQTGFGRTGESWCGIEHWNVEPDIVTFAKGIANGFALGATTTTDEIAKSWQAATISTFGGNPVSATAALATLDVMARENIPERAARLGARLRERLGLLKEKHPLVGDVRGLGLMQAVELVRDRKTKQPAMEETDAFMEACKRRGLLIGKGGLYGNVARLSPPMLIEPAEIDAACDRMDQALSEVERGGAPAR